MNGILVQLPVPAHLDGRALTELVRPEKDVDGLTTFNAGMLALGTPQLVGATPLGVMVLLEEAGVELEGAEAVVVGRSNLFGKPMAQLLLGANATVTVCHSRTRDLAAVCAARRRADRGDRAPAHAGRRARQAGGGRDRRGHEPHQPRGGSTTRAGSSATSTTPPRAEIASAITPVPGGVGPMTIAMLLRNTLQAARAAGRARPGSEPRMTKLRAGEWTAVAGIGCTDRRADPALV